MPLLDPDTPTTIRLGVFDADMLATRALVRIGLSDEEAAITAAHLVDAELCGYGYAGLPRILALAEAAEMKAPRRPPAITHETPVSALIDGGNSLGYVAVRYGADIAAAKADAAGIAVVGVNNAWNSGRVGYYAEAIARRGLIAIHTVSTPALVAPRGATERVLGTNPLSIGIPATPDPFVLDIATGAVAWADVASKAKVGEHYPEAVGTDRLGRPTGAALDLLTGALWPFGGHKGFGLSLAIQALGILAGAGRRRGDVVDFGYLLIALRPDILLDAREFETGLAELLDRLRSLPISEGETAVRIPSERAFRDREIRRGEGIVIERDVYARIAAL